MGWAGLARPLLLGSGWRRTRFSSRPLSGPLWGSDLFQISPTRPLTTFSSPHPICLLALRSQQPRGQTSCPFLGTAEKQGRQEPAGSPPQPSWAGSKPRTPTSEAYLSEDVLGPNWQSSGEKAAEAPGQLFWVPRHLCEWSVVIQGERDCFCSHVVNGGVAESPFCLFGFF